ncbi:MAG: gamma-glutamyl-gamma-aminobutyrate hydrolase family protein, partial [Methylibium sp.]|nr:gamma-glutamyl-gamma-aminobutyrate hydrolase family protein [Methylibium sp.]
YGLSHPVQVVPGGLLDKLIGTASFQVNSLHGQGIKRLADGLRVEARAPDGVIEAISLAGARGFALGVQWHPEWQARDNPVSMKLLRAFGDACRAFRENRRKTAHPAVEHLPVP